MFVDLFQLCLNFAHIRVVERAPYPEFTGCFVTTSNQTLVVNWILLAAFEACKSAAFHIVTYSD